MSRGTARSIRSSGRPERSAITSESASRSITLWGEEVEETTMSAVGEQRRQLLEAHRPAAEALGDADRAVVVAVGDEDGVHAAGGERPRRELGGLARADDQHRALLEVAERALRKLDRDLRDRKRPLRERRLGARALAGGKGAAEEAVEHGAGRVLDQRELVGALDLALDLGLADDHRLEAGGDAEEVVGGAGAAHRVEVGDELGRPDVRLAGRARRAPATRRSPRSEANM